MADKDEIRDEDELPGGEKAEAEDAIGDLTPAVPEDEDDGLGEIGESDLARLSDEERAAMAEDDGDEGDPEAEEDDEDAGEQAEDEAEPAAAAAEDDAPPPVAEEEAPQPEPAPREPEPDLTDAFAAITAEVKDARAKLFENYNDGEMTREEYLEQIDALDQQAEAKKSAAREEALWEQTRTAFLAEAKTYMAAEANAYLRDPAHIEGYDRHVRAVTASPAYDGMTHRQKLDLAHRLYRTEAEALGKELPAPAAKPAPKAEGPKPEAKAEAKPRPKKPDPPRTIRDIPAAGAARVNDSRWGELQERIDNATDPYELERVMASMSDEEREAFASADV